MKISAAKYLLLPFFAGLFITAQAKQVPPPPDPPRLVVDFTNIMRRTEVDALEKKLVAYDDSTSTQIAIVIEQTLSGDDIFDYSYRLAEAWGIGRKGKNNGILIYVALADHKLRIQTGYG
ncbi:MAG: TPM domain-containing protein, partial [Saprospiraceae bacterium]